MSHASPDHAVDIIVCVHNSPDDVMAYLESVKTTIRPSDRLIIVDYGSETETRDICKYFAEALGENCILIRNEKGSGFCRAANIGLNQAAAETIILLNSDTLVAGDWIKRITSCMVANWKIRIVGPLSNSGGWQSVPHLVSEKMLSNVIASDPQTVLDIHNQFSDNRRRFGIPLVEQLNGFCIAISKEVFREIGHFDEAHFPMGYGEESDFVLRALDAGFLCAVATDCFVYHAKTKSYGVERRRIHNKAGAAQLTLLHGREGIVSAVKQTRRHGALEAIRAECVHLFAERGWLVK